MKRAFHNVKYYLRKRPSIQQTPEGNVSEGSANDKDSYDDAPSSSDGAYTRCERQMSEREFVCACCMEVMVEATTLMCGHSFCRHCLAQWYLHANTKKKECIECKQEWMGYPKVNIALRYVMAVSCF